MQNNIIGLDPGRDKCVIAVVSPEGTVLFQKVIQTDNLSAQVTELLTTYEIHQLVIGNGTTSKTAQEAIRGACPELNIAVVDEYYTTQLARQEYWRANPPKGWRKLLPVSMQVPPEPVDDFVAIILVRRFLQKNMKI